MILKAALSIATITSARLFAGEYTSDVHWEILRARQKMEGLKSLADADKEQVQSYAPFHAKLNKLVTEAKELFALGEWHQVTRILLSVKMRIQELKPEVAIEVNSMLADSYERMELPLFAAEYNKDAIAAAITAGLDNDLLLNERVSKLIAGLSSLNAPEIMKLLSSVLSNSAFKSDVHIVYECLKKLEQTNEPDLAYDWASVQADRQDISANIRLQFATFASNRFAKNQNWLAAKSYLSKFDILLATSGEIDSPTLLNWAIVKAKVDRKLNNPLDAIAVLLPFTLTSTSTTTSIPLNEELMFAYAQLDKYAEGIAFGKKAEESCDGMKSIRCLVIRDKLTEILIDAGRSEEALARVAELEREITATTLMFEPILTKKFAEEHLLVALDKSPWWIEQSALVRGLVEKSKHIKKTRARIKQSLHAHSELVRSVAWMSPENLLGDAQYQALRSERVLVSVLDIASHAIAAIKKLNARSPSKQSPNTDKEIQEITNNLKWHQHLWARWYNFWNLQNDISRAFDQVFVSSVRLESQKPNPTPRIESLRNHLRSQLKQVSKLQLDLDLSKIQALYKLHRSSQIVSRFDEKWSELIADIEAEHSFARENIDSAAEYDLRSWELLLRELEVFKAESVRNQMRIDENIQNRFSALAETLLNQKRSMLITQSNLDKQHDLIERIIAQNQKQITTDISTSLLRANARIERLKAEINWVSSKEGRHAESKRQTNNL